MSINDAISDDASQSLHTILDWLRWTTSQLVSSDVFFGHGTDNPWDEALALILPSLGLPYDTPEAVYAARLTQAEKQQLLALVEQRINHKVPVSYLTHRAIFCGLEFYVDERVLVPRSPIAELIESRFEPYLGDQEVGNILDLCTGSGCIAIALAHQFPVAVVTATDLSTDALEVAEINLQQYQLFDQLSLLQSDLFDSIPAQQFDLIVSNPPYVDQDDMDALPDEFRHEPKLGLESGFDGLDITRRILAQAPDFLSEDGLLVVEVGNSWPALVESYPNAEFQWHQFERGGDGVFVINKAELLALRDSLTLN